MVKNRHMLTKDDRIKGGFVVFVDYSQYVLPNLRIASPSPRDSEKLNPTNKP